VIFGAAAAFSGATVAGTATFRGASFEHGLRGVGVRFDGPADFMAATFHAVANFTDATFAAGAVFSSTDFRGNATFRGVAFSGPTMLSRTSDYTSVDDRWDRVDVDGRTVTETAVVFRNVICSGKLRLVDVTLDGAVRVAASSLTDETFITDVTPESEVTGIVFDGVDAVAGEVVPDFRVPVTIRDSTIGDLQLPGDAFEDVTFEDVTFDGFDFGAYKSVLAAREWRLHDPSADADPARLENLYLRAKNGANEFGETRAAGEFFQHEMRSRQAAHAARAREALGSRALRRTARYG